ncbi:hypothetical protein LAZ67_X003862 [Cordylochernes scorpioides]|uniref:Mos1 transposase HTH domain-containing protein n=1 Tax=Cordylochernes scorpioides TaxID=51811 RepID=A0ABY6LYK3_9ARAC|nr:hypothetical protein LAZ67_X003862 [Cordylochernes scorpioides]
MFNRNHHSQNNGNGAFNFQYFNGDGGYRAVNVCSTFRCSTHHLYRQNECSATTVTRWRSPSVKHMCSWSVYAFFIYNIVCAGLESIPSNVPFDHCEDIPNPEDYLWIYIILCLKQNENPHELLNLILQFPLGYQIFTLRSCVRYALYSPNTPQDVLVEIVELPYGIFTHEELTTILHNLLALTTIFYPIYVYPRLPYNSNIICIHQQVNNTKFRQVLKEDKKQESSKLVTNEIRAVMKYLCKKGISPKEIYEDMVDTLREDAPSYSTVKKWVAAFKLGRISTEDEHRPGKPIESVTQENIDKIHDLVMLDRRMTVRQIEETLDIPKTTVDRIVREHLGLRKLSARWVPKLSTPDQKAVRRKLSSDNLALFEAKPEKFVNIFVTMDKTWAHHFAPESKQQSMQWTHSGSPPPKKPRQFH